MKSFASSPVFIMRFKATGKRPIDTVKSQFTLASEKHKHSFPSMFVIYSSISQYSLCRNPHDDDDDYNKIMR